MTTPRQPSLPRALFREAGAGLGAAALVVALAGIIGCTTGVQLGAHDAGAVEPCGPVTCAVGEVCCNPSCGICVRPGLGCTEMACGGPCDAFYAEGTGTCASALGWLWNGFDCAPLIGCTCVGSDCGRLYADAAACRATHALCEPGCVNNDDCPFGSYCSLPISACSLPRGALGVCTVIPTSTTCPAVYQPVCGCDLVTYENGCAATVAGVSVAFEGACDACAPEDARAEGDCDLLLGRVWNGMTCVELTGCTCIGADCPLGLVPPGTPSCERRHEGCLMPDLPCGDVACFGRSEYCRLEIPSGAASCVTSTCEPPRCDCIPEMFAECSVDPTGGVTVRVY